MKDFRAHIKQTILEILQSDIDKAAEIFSRLKGKRVYVTTLTPSAHDKGVPVAQRKPNTYGGVLTYLGPNRFMGDSWGIQATVDRMPVTNVDLDSIIEIPDKSIIKKQDLGDMENKNSNEMQEDIVRKGYTYKNWKKIPDTPRQKIVKRDRDKKIWKVVHGKTHDDAGKPIDQYKDDTGATIYTDYDDAMKMQRAIILRGESVEVVADETLLDEVVITHDELNSDIWNANGTLKSEIRLRLLKIAKEFYESLELTAKIKDVYLLGSLASYNYTRYSDLDVHVVIDYSDVNDDVKLVEDYLWARKTIWNMSHDILVKGYDVETYVQDVNHKAVNEGIFSLLNNEWVKEPKQNTSDVDMEKVKQKADKYMQQIDSIAREIALSDETRDLQQSYDKLDVLKEKIVQGRKDALKTEDDIYGLENMVFKTLRNNGYLEKLGDLKNQLYDKINTI